LLWYKNGGRVTNECGTDGTRAANDRISETLNGSEFEELGFLELNDTCEGSIPTPSEEKPASGGPGVSDDLEKALEHA
jgi:hypothetical protein